MSDRTGYGLALEIALASAPANLTYIPETFDGKPPVPKRSYFDVSHYQSPEMINESAGGWSDPGSSSFSLNYYPGSPADLFLLGLGGEPLIVRITFANGVQIIFPAGLESYETDIPRDDRKTAELTFKVTGAPDQSPPAAPRNLIVPTIAGAAKVGHVMTVKVGNWAGAQTYALQWQADTGGNGTFVDIAGATKKTFVPTADQVGDDLRCKVTASNQSVYQDEVFSAASDAVVV